MPIFFSIIENRGSRIYMDIAQRLKFFRERKNFTTNKLANLSGISQSFLRDIELSKKKPTVETLRILCDTLGISLRDFFDEETVKSITDDPLIQEIYRLTPQQRSKLAEFLKLINT